MVTLSPDELNAIRYVCGFVICKILKKYEQSDDVSCQFVECLGDLTVVIKNDLLTYIYTRNWFDEVNRGDL